MMSERHYIHSASIIMLAALLLVDIGITTGAAGDAS